MHACGTRIEKGRILKHRESGQGPEKGKMKEGYGGGIFRVSSGNETLDLSTSSVSLFDELIACYLNTFA